jgi:hypothetical protein
MEKRMLPLMPVIMRSIQIAVEAAVGNPVTLAVADVTDLEVHAVTQPITSFDSVRTSHPAAIATAKQKGRAAIGIEMSEVTAAVEVALAERITKTAIRSGREGQVASAIETIVVNLEAVIRLLELRSLHSASLLANPCGMVEDSVLRLLHLPHPDYLPMASRDLRGAVKGETIIGDVIVVETGRGDVLEMRLGKWRTRGLGGMVIEMAQSSYVTSCGISALF